MVLEDKVKRSQYEICGGIMKYSYATTYKDALKEKEMWDRHNARTDVGGIYPGWKATIKKVK